MDPCVSNAETSKRIFLNLLLFAILLIGAVGVGIWYLISPRLQQLHHGLPSAVLLGWLALCCFLFLGFLLISLSVLLNKDLLLCFGKKEFSVAYLLPLVLKLGRKLGVPYDKLAHSFVRVSNALTGIRARRIPPGSILILLPRCLEKNLQDQIIALAERKNIPVYRVPGGELARSLVTEKRPRAVIGVACERDLLSGIKDLEVDIPIIGIPNLRPEGPCKNTRIDLDELKRALDLFTGTVSQTNPN